MDKEEDTQQELMVDLDLHQIILLTQQLLTDLIENEGVDCESIFNSQEIPSISIDAYLRRLHRYTHFSPQCIIIAIVYLDRYNMREQQFSLNWHNAHRLFLSCLMIAVKFHDDIYFDNLTFEKGGGVSIAQLSLFEMQIFEKMDYNAFVEGQEYQALVEKLYSVYGPQQQQ